MCAHRTSGTTSTLSKIYRRTCCPIRLNQYHLYCPCPTQDQRYDLHALCNLTWSLAVFDYLTPERFRQVQQSRLIAVETPMEGGM